MASDKFSPLDYVILVLLLVFSAAIGLYHAMCGGRQKTSSEYFLANRSMSPYPVALSVLVSIVSAETYIGMPVEVYLFGPVYWQNAFSRPIGALCVMFIILPVFYNLQVASIFEYLELRFNSIVRYTGMVTNMFYILIYMGVVIYIPSLALNVVTGMSIEASILTFGLVCTFYTTIGGIKAVVWTDVFQSVVMICGMIVAVIGGIVSVGGVAEVWKRAEDGRRTDLFDFRVDPTIRYSLWSCLIGGVLLACSFGGANQLLVQRYLTCRSLKSARIAAFIGISMYGLVEIICVITGTVTYAYFTGCDPVSNKDISRPDQLMPFLMIRLFSRIPGLTGILVSAAFSASLSSVSSGINALTTLTGQGIFRKLWPRMKESKFTFLSKVTSIFYGLLCITLAFLAPLLGNVLQLVLGITGVFNGPVLGIFLLGVMFPWANWIGALVGFWIGLAAGVWIQIGSFFYPPVRDLLPLSTDFCPLHIEPNSTLTPISLLERGDIYTTTSSAFDPLTDLTSPETDSLPSITWLYHISFQYFGVVAFLISFSVGAILSLLVGRTDPSTVDGKLLSPVTFAIYRKLPLSIQEKIGLQEDPYEETTPGHSKVVDTNV